MKRPCLGITSLLLAVLLTACSTEEPQIREVLRPVRYQPVFASGGTRVRAFSGVAKAAVESNLSFKVGGTIEALMVKVGDNVAAGQNIARLDATDYRLRVQEAEASLKQAEAQLRNASANYERVQALYENRNASRNDLDAARAAAESADATVASAKKRLELARLQLDYTTLHAPIAGAIAEVPVDVNENVASGRTIAVLTSGGDLEVEVAVPEILISQIREGDAVTATFDAISDRRYNGRVSEVGVASTATVTTFPVTIILDKADEAIRPGMAAEVSFTFQSRHDREMFVVPPVAVGEDREGRFVFVVSSVEPGVGQVERRPVVVGDLTEDGLEISQGLADGEWLVTAGVSKLTDGQRVKLPAPAGSGS